MLLHSVYFETLAEIGNTRADEWHSLVAGLVVLRLVNEWLDFGPRSIVTDEIGLRTVRQLIENVPNPHLIKPLLADVVQRIEKAEQAELQIVVHPLTAYSRALTQEARFHLAEEVLMPLHERALRAKDPKTIIAVSRELGFVLRKSGKLDDAAEAYDTAQYYATKTTDVASILMTEIGKAKIVAEQGNLSLADTMCADVQKQATALGETDILSCTLHDRGFFAALHHDARAALRFLRGAFLHSTTEREFVMGDLACVLASAERISAARNKSAKLAIGARNRTVRWQAITNLMRLAYMTGNQTLFESYRTGLSLAPLPPWQALACHGVAINGYRKFGDLAQVEEERRQAYAVALKHKIDTNYCAVT